MPLTDVQVEAIKAIITAGIGAGGAMGAQWLAKKRTKEEEEADTADAFTKAATGSIQATQVVVDILQEMVKDQQVYFSDQTKRLEEGFNKKIADLNLYIDDLKKKNEELHNNNGNLVRDNTTLSVKLAAVTTDYETQRKLYEDLKTRQTHFETAYVTGDHTKVMEEVNQRLKEENAKEQERLNGISFNSE